MTCLGFLGSPASVALLSKDVGIDAGNVDILPDGRRQGMHGRRWKVKRKAKHVKGADDGPALK